MVENVGNLEPSVLIVNCNWVSIVCSTYAYGLVLMFLIELEVESCAWDSLVILVLIYTELHSCTGAT